MFGQTVIANMFKTVQRIARFRGSSRNKHLHMQIWDGNSTVKPARKIFSCTSRGIPTKWYTWFRIVLKVAIEKITRTNTDIAPSPTNGTFVVTWNPRIAPVVWKSTPHAINHSGGANIVLFIKKYLGALSSVRLPKWSIFLQIARRWAKFNMMGRERRKEGWIVI